MRPTLSTRRCVASPEESYSVSCSCNKCNSRPSLQINSINSGTNYIKDIDDKIDFLRNWFMKGDLLDGYTRKEKLLDEKESVHVPFWNIFLHDYHDNIKPKRKLIICT